MLSGNRDAIIQDVEYANEQKVVIDGFPEEIRNDNSPQCSKENSYYPNGPLELAQPMLSLAGTPEVDHDFPQKREGPTPVLKGPLPYPGSVLGERSWIMQRRGTRNNCASQAFIYAAKSPAICGFQDCKPNQRLIWS